MSSTPIPDILKGYTFHKLSCGYGARPKGLYTYLNDCKRIAFKNIPEPMCTALMLAALVEAEYNSAGRFGTTVLGFKVSLWDDEEIWVEEKDEDDE